MKKHLVLACLAVLMLISIFGCIGQTREDPWRKATELVAIGESREKAIELLSKEAWYHQPCGDRTDLFFYGDHHYDKADIVIVRSILDGDEYKVEHIGSYDEPNVWHTAYADCIDRTRFED